MPEEKKTAVMVNSDHALKWSPFRVRVASILATIPATACSAVRSFSAPPRIKTFLRSNGARPT